MSLTPKQWLILAAVVGLLASGWYFRDLQQSKADFKQVRGEFRGQVDVDEATAEKLRIEAIADSKRGRIVNQRDEAARRDKAYQDYLDSPIPEQSLRMYRDAAKIDYGADGTDPGTDQED